MARAKLGSHGVLEFQSSYTRVPGAPTSWAPAALCDGSSDSGQAPLFMGSAPPMCHLTMFFMSALSRDVVVFNLAEVLGTIQFCHMPRTTGTDEELSPKSLLLRFGSYTPCSRERERSTVLT